MKPLFLGGHPAVDFLNTFMVPRGTPIELIGDGRSLVDWLRAAGLLDPGAAHRLLRRLGVAELDAAAEEARRFREWTRDWLTRLQGSPAGAERSDLRLLNRLLEHEQVHRELVAAPGRPKVVERTRVEESGQVLALVAAQVARLVTGEDLARLKRCAGPDCTLWFLDRTKPGLRIYCSAAGCGNRAKVAAFRERRRAQGVGTRT